MKMQITLVAAVVLIFSYAATAQYGDAEYRGGNHLLNGGVRTWIENNGVMGGIGRISFEWPAGTHNEYIVELDPLLGVQFVHPSGDTLVSVVTSEGWRGQPDESPNGDFWGFEPVPGFRADPPPAIDRSVAVSDQPDTWPNSWQAVWMGNDEIHTLGVQEAYFQVDDHADHEWRERNGEILYPFPDDTTRNGLGLRMAVRYVVFNQPVLRDCLLMIFEIFNDGTVEFEETRFGLMVGDIIGGRNDSEDDLAHYSVEQNLVYMFDEDDEGSEGWVPVNDSLNVGFVGIKLLDTPDNLGLTAYDRFSPPGLVHMNDDVALWERMENGHFHSTSHSGDADLMMSTGGFQLDPGAMDTVMVAVIYGINPDNLLYKAEQLQYYIDYQGIPISSAETFVPAPHGVSLHGNHPNPFNPVTEIEYSIARAGDAELRVYDVLGREVAVLVEGVRSAGSYTVSFDGSGLPSGVYIYRLQAGGFSESRKMVLLK